jgi:RNA polymerase sigma-70 factor (ECF subfamily)
MTDDRAETLTLITASQSGDRVAREHLFARCLPRVRQMVALRVGVPVSALPAHAEDTVQDTLLNALQALPTFELRSIGQFHNWLARIAENRLRNDARDRRSAKAAAIGQRLTDLDLSATLFPANDRTPSSQAVLREQRVRLESAILALPGLYRRAIELRDIAGMDHAELAAELRRTEANCRKIYQRAREMLLQRLGG